ncbi:two component transcriptional regulator, LuxR family [Streptomyces zhaozhouensis]|uniref:Two component transcriptional regulator, LuxR family n=1 Tax=Streptomyces zhaozhouensis TaxID=1300267 RepID=A0A286DXV5_9ACTN|nr:response regulator transcription factor [Streptomyces zhaozhouensis]SOD63473.1 two component transcriptional regulator, LuxR family [Streptomyces zhaozhouensis]
MDRIRVLVVDEHRIFAESLATALAAEADVEAVALGGVPAARALLERTRAGGGRPFGVLLLDAGLEGALESTAEGPALLAWVAEALPALRTVMLAASDDPVAAARALSADARGWVAKDSSLARLLRVVRGVLHGETHLPPALLTGVLRELQADRRHRGERERLVESLTPRELEVLRCMLAGLGRKAVAERLYLSPHTVRTHMQNVLGKLGVHSTLAAVALARRAGIPPAE